MVLFENVPEFKDWGPVDEDGKPTRNGEIFDQWINAIHSLGYSVDWKVLNAADYGDATSRRRLFVIGRRNGKPEFPEPTHSETGEGDTEEWRSAAEIIDSDESGESIWGRSRPLVENTMERIAEGLREYGSESVAQYADVVEDLGKEDVEELQERIVPAESASLAAQVMDRPYLVAPPEESNRDEQGPDTTRLAFPSNVAPPATQAAASWDGQIESVSAEHSADRLCTPYLLGQHGGATPRSVDDSQVPTITADGYIRLFDIQGRHIQPGPTRPRGTAHSGLQATQPHQVNTQESVQDLMQFSHGGKRLSLSNPLPTITTARGGVFGLSQSDLLPIGSSYAEGPLRNWSVDRSPPLGSNAVDAADLPTGFLIQYHGNSGARALSAPLPTITTRDSLALVVPDINPYFGLDIRFRMLQPRELAAAMGFPESFEFAGTKTERVRQIGNAVPVNLGRSLVRSLLESSSPTLTDYLDGDSARVPVEDTSTTTQAAGD